MISRRTITMQLLLIRSQFDFQKIFFAYGASRFYYLINVVTYGASRFYYLINVVTYGALRFSYLINAVTYGALIGFLIFCFLI